LESCFHKRQVSFLVVKTAKYKRGIRHTVSESTAMFIPRQYIHFENRITNYVGYFAKL